MKCKARLQKTFLEDGECEVSYVVYFIEFCPGQDFGIGICIRMYCGGPGSRKYRSNPVPGTSRDPSSLQEIPNPDYRPG